MNLDDMKTELSRQDEKLNAAVRINAELVRELALQSSRRFLTGLSVGLIAQLAIGFLAIAALGRFIAGHLATPAFFLPALALDAFAIWYFASLVQQWVMLRRIGYDGTIVGTQRQLELLKIRRIRTTKWVVVFAGALWTPLLIVGALGLFGINAYDVFSTTWFVTNVVFGLTMIPLTLWVAKQFASRVQGAPALRQFMDDVAGHGLVRSISFVEELSRLSENERHS